MDNVIPIKVDGVGKMIVAELEKGYSRRFG